MSPSGIIWTTKSSSSPGVILSGISQMPTRGSPSMMVPSGQGEGGVSILSCRSFPAMDRQRFSRLSFASARMPIVRLPGTLVSTARESRSFSQLSLIKMPNVDAVGCCSQSRWTTYRSSRPSTRRTCSNRDDVGRATTTGLRCLVPQRLGVLPQNILRRVFGLCIFRDE